MTSSPSPINAQWLREQLAQQGKTLSDLADHMGRSPSSITQMAKGGRHIKVSEIGVIAAYLDVSVDHVMAKLCGLGTDEHQAGLVTTGVAVTDGTVELSASEVLETLPPGLGVGSYAIRLEDETSLLCKALLFAPPMQTARHAINRQLGRMVCVHLADGSYRIGRLVRVERPRRFALITGDGKKDIIDVKGSSPISWIKMPS